MSTNYRAFGWAGLFLLILLIVYLFIFALTKDWYQSIIATVFGSPAHMIFFVFGSRQHLESTTSSIDFEMAGFKKWFLRNIEQFTPDTVLFGESLFNRIDDDEGYRKNIKFFKKLKSDYNNRRPDKTAETLIPMVSVIIWLSLITGHLSIDHTFME